MPEFVGVIASVALSLIVGVPIRWLAVSDAHSCVLEQRDHAPNPRATFSGGHVKDDLGGGQ